MTSQFLLVLLLIIFILGGIAIVLCQFNILWKSFFSANINKQPPKALHEVEPIALRVIERHDMTQRHFSVRLQAANGGAFNLFSPGQYLTLMTPNEFVKDSVPKGERSKKLLKRCYSLASWQENTNFYELGIQCEDEGQVSTWLHRYLQVGTVIEALPPKGNFVIEPNQPLHTVLVAGGIGITPLRAMVHQFISQMGHEFSADKSMSLFYSAKSAAEMCYLNEFTQLAQQYSCFHFSPFVSKPGDANTESHWQGGIGRLCAEQLTHQLDTYLNDQQSEGRKRENKTKCHYYLCGPNTMMDDITTGLIQQGIPEASIHFECFGISNEAISEDSFSVKLGENTNIVFQKHRTLLDAMEEQGVEIQSECRTGECGQCKIKVKKGTTRRLIETDVHLNEGEILSCCNVPESDLQIEV